MLVTPIIYSPYLQSFLGECMHEQKYCMHLRMNQNLQTGRERGRKEWTDWFEAQNPGSCSVQRAPTQWLRR